MAASASTQLHIAIIGGGLAGTTLANALNQISHIQVQVYEAAASFTERGAAVALSTNALQALEQIFPPGGKDALLKKAGAVPLNSVRSVVGSGPHAGKIIFDSAGTESEVVVHRASLLRELVSPLPQDILHPNKRLSSIKPVPGTHHIEVAFEDGTKGEFDGVIGADGIFGSVRSHVLQDKAQKYAATPAGFWDCRNLVPMARAKAVLGEDLFAEDRQCGWVGDGAFLMHDVLENSTMVQCVISAVERSPTNNRKRSLNREILTKTLQSWLDGPIAKGMIELALDQDDLHGYSQWEHKATPYYSAGAICIIGDAAHAMTPWQGSGAAMAFEDAMVMQELLSHVQSPTQIEAAFKVYDALRRPRCQRVIDSSRETGMILCGQNADAGLDPEKLGQLLATKWDFIAGLDMKEHKKDAVAKLNDCISEALNLTEA
ncbi:salicylate hydroxylase [Xylaria flabelliformis]|nr:salicylate hydroxylase [Xylaria flabelliformis]